MLADGILSDAAAKLSKSGASKGGEARAKSLTPEKRRDIARKAVEARWAKAGKTQTHTPSGESPLPVAKHKGILNLMDFQVPCYVLDNGQRIIGRVSVTELLTSIKGGGDLEKYLRVSSLKSFINVEMVLERMTSFQLLEVQGLGKEVKGMPADILIEICLLAGT